MKVIPPMEIVDAGGAFTRAGPATYFDQAGVMRTAAPNVLRLRWDPDTGQPLGPILEAAAVNLADVSANVAGWNLQPNGAVIQSNTVASVDGTGTASQVYLAGSTFDGDMYKTFTGLTVGAIYTFSIYCRLMLPPFLALAVNNTQGWNTVGYGAVITSKPGPSGFSRVQLSFVAPGGGAVSMHIGGNANAGSPVQQPGQVQLCCWQLEIGEQATSYVPTAGSPVARAADVFTGTGLLGSTVPEDDAPEWSIGATYAAAQRVMRTAGGVHRVYESLVANNLGIAPESAAAAGKWLDLGSTNRWRMLRTDANLQTTGASALTVSVRLPKRVQGIGLLRVDADRITVSSTDGYSSTQDLRKRYTQGWYDYFYGQLRYRTVGLFLDLPRSNSNTVFTITIERLSGGPVSCGPVVFGNPVDLGEVQEGSEYGIRDFSTVSRDTFGNATLIKRKRIPSTSQRTLMEKDQVEVVQQALGDLTASVALWFGLEEVGDGYFSSLAVLGLITNSKLTLQSTYAALALDLEGL